MTSWRQSPRWWMRMHNPKLRERHTYRVAQRATTASGSSTPFIRLLCCLLVLGAGLWATTGEGRGDRRWWLALIAVAAVGAALAVVHAQAETIRAMMRSRSWPVRMLGRNLEKFGWNRVNLPGVLETVGPLLMAWMVGAPSGPFQDRPAAQLVGAAATLLFSALGTLHWATDSIFYQPDKSKAWPVGAARLMRAAVPVLLAMAYGSLLARNTGGPTSSLPWLAAVFLLIHPAVVYFERVLMSAEIERRPAVEAQRLTDATVVHARISNPMHFVLTAVRDRPAEAEQLMVYLRSELERCLQELDHGHDPATVQEVFTSVRGGLLPEDRERLALASSAVDEELTSVDASLTRSVLADLCCNALKEAHAGQLPEVVVSVTYDEERFQLVIDVADNGPGMGEDWQPGPSLRRLHRLLDKKAGGLSYRPNSPAGMVVRAKWQRESVEVER
ncbi:hypothetical protein ACODT3_35810 [Streptomyces sp. 4.24]|uniref:hypothetical protein n=1 Tax=Streptomyces tritrimontium TaxID=3406573 RepID=UPI003BB58349